MGSPKVIQFINHACFCRPLMTIRVVPERRRVRHRLGLGGAGPSTRPLPVFREQVRADLKYNKKTIDVSV